MGPVARREAADPCGVRYTFGDHWRRGPPGRGGTHLGTPAYAVSGIGLSGSGARSSLLCSSEKENKRAQIIK